MLDVKVNYRGSYSSLQCELCGKHEDSQESLLSCENLTDSTRLVSYFSVNDDLIAQDVKTQMIISAILKKNYNLRNKLIKEIKNKS